jgi:C_GCAxxG_C_C family probable redox protein
MNDRSANALAAAKTARQCELDFGCCPQCVLSAIKDVSTHVTDETIKASHGLSGGGALTGLGMCGALTGGLMALGTKRGRDADKFHRGKCITNFKAGEKLVSRFKEEFNGTTCQELQKKFTGKTYDLWQPDEYQAFDDERGDNCARATELVTKWVVEML